MDTITLARDLYSDRRDNEDRVYLTFATMKAAALKWVAARPGRSWDTTAAEAFVFADTEAIPVITVVDPDKDMEDLYLADELPFSVVASPFAIGDVVALSGGVQRRKVVEVKPDGVIRAEPMDTPGMILTHRASEFTLIRTAAEHARLDGTPEPKPVRTFIVMVAADSEHELSTKLAEVYGAASATEIPRP